MSIEIKILATGTDSLKYQLGELMTALGALSATPKVESPQMELPLPLNKTHAENVLSNPSVPPSEKTRKAKVYAEEKVKTEVEAVKPTASQVPAEVVEPTPDEMAATESPRTFEQTNAILIKVHRKFGNKGLIDLFAPFGATGMKGSKPLQQKDYAAIIEAAETVLA